MARPRVHPIGTNRTQVRRKRVVEEGGLVIEVFFTPRAAAALERLRDAWELDSLNEAINQAVVICGLRTKRSARRIVRDEDRSTQK